MGLKFKYWSCAVFMFITVQFYKFLSFGVAMVEALTIKTTAWEKERGTEFLYDGVSTFLISIKFWDKTMHHIKN